jgi:hypothetical protein
MQGVLQACARTPRRLVLLLLLVSLAGPAAGALAIAGSAPAAKRHVPAKKKKKKKKTYCSAAMRKSKHSAAVKRRRKHAKCPVFHKKTITKPLVVAAPPGAAAAVAPPEHEPPRNTAPPVITGSAAEGETLSASLGSWAGSPTGFSYQWEACNALGEGCLPVAGAVDPTHQLSAGDVGGTIRAVVSATNVSGTTVASSAATGEVIGSPDVLVGSTSLQPSSDNNSAGLAEVFQYTAARSGTIHSLGLYVAGGTTAPLLDVGIYSSVSGHAKKLLAQATINAPLPGGWNAVGITPVPVTQGTIYWLAALAPVGSLSVRDVASGGGPSQGSASGSLGELPASWSEGASWANSPASFYASGEVVESPPSAPIDTALPSISGGLIEGQTLKASSGSWSNSPISFAYQWQDCNAAGAGCANIKDATTASHLLAEGEVGATVRVVVTATNAAGSTPASSAATAPVEAATKPAAPHNTVLPVVSGATVEGQTLSVSAGSWSGSPTSFGYQWQDCNASGGGCSNISGANASTHLLSAGEVGDTLRAVVTATNAAGSTAASSSATGEVTKAAGGSCTAKVSSLAAANTALKTAGAVVCLAAGTYAPETPTPTLPCTATNYYGCSVFDATPASTATLRPESGTVTIQGATYVEGQHLLLEGIHFTEFDAGDNAGNTFSSPDGSNVTFKNDYAHVWTLSSVANVTIEGGEYGPSSCGLSPSEMEGKKGWPGYVDKVNYARAGDIHTENIRINHVKFQYYQSYNYSGTYGCHMECLFFEDGANLHLEHSTFSECGVFDVFTQESAGGVLGHIYIENNWLAPPVDLTGVGGNPIPTFEPIAIKNEVSNTTIKGNHVLAEIATEDRPSEGLTGIAVEGNFATNLNFGCPAGVRYAANVWESAGQSKCSASDQTGVTPLPFANHETLTGINYTLVSPFQVAPWWPEG